MGLDRIGQYMASLVENAARNHSMGPILEILRWLAQQPGSEMRIQALRQATRRYAANANINPSLSTEMFRRVVLLAHLAGLGEGSLTITDIQPVFDMPPLDAIEFFRAKLTMPPSDFYALDSIARPYAFSMIAFSDIQILDRFAASLASAIREGVSEEVWATRTQFLVEHARELSLPYLKNVYRSNVQTALNAGREGAQARDPAIEILIYRTVLDGRVRPTHRLMHGFTAPKNDEVWNRWYPPNGYNCRCIVQGISKRVLEIRKKRKRAGELKTKVPQSEGEEIRPDNGWSARPVFGRVPRRARAELRRLGYIVPSNP